VFDSRYLAPECWDGTFVPASDIFAFGLILFDILSGSLAFPADWRLAALAFKVAIDGWRPEIPDSVLPGTRALICNCWAADLRGNCRSGARRLSSYGELKNGSA
jgi:serine/threonine protein kinase